MPELIRKPIQNIKAADASTSSTPVPRSEASTPTTTVSEKAEVETENKPIVSRICFVKIIINIKLCLYFIIHLLVYIIYSLYIFVIQDTDEKSKETSATSDTKSNEGKTDEGTSVVKTENESSVKTENPEESNVSKSIIRIILFYTFYATLDLKNIYMFCTYFSI